MSTPHSGGPRAAPAHGKTKFPAVGAVSASLLPAPTVQAAPAVQLGPCLPPRPVKTESIRSQLPRAAGGPRSCGTGAHAPLAAAQPGTAAALSAPTGSPTACGWDGVVSASWEPTDPRSQNPKPLALGASGDSSYEVEAALDRLPASAGAAGASQGVQKVDGIPCLLPGLGGAALRRKPPLEWLAPPGTGAIQLGTSPGIKIAGDAAEPSKPRVPSNDGGSGGRSAKRKRRQPAVKPRVGSSSPFKGVSWTETCQKWRAQYWDGTKVRISASRNIPQAAAPVDICFITFREAFSLPRGFGGRLISIAPDKRCLRCMFLSTAPRTWAVVEP